MDVFKVAFIVMAFYAVGITALVYSMPDDAVINSYNEVFAPSDDYNLNSIGSISSSALDDQTNLPSIDVGALVFYSGNILIDLLLNFVTALPQMISLLINGVLFLFNINSYFVDLLQIFTSVVTVSLYIIGLIQLLTSVRSGARIP